MLGKFRLEGLDQLPILLVNRAHAAEMLIVFGNFQHSLPRNILPAEDVFQEGDDVGRPLRTAEGDDDHRVVRILAGRDERIERRLSGQLAVFPNETERRRDSRRSLEIDPDGVRTRVAGVKGRSPRPLDDGAGCALAEETPGEQPCVSD